MMIAEANGTSTHIIILVNMKMAIDSQKSIPKLYENYRHWKNFKTEDWIRLVPNIKLSRSFTCKA